MLVRRVDCSDAQTLYWVEAILVQDGSGLRSNLNGRSIFGDFSFWTKLAQNLVSKRTTRLEVYPMPVDTFLLLIIRLSKIC